MAVFANGECERGLTLMRAAVELAEGRLRDGLPLRAEINVVGYLARKPEGAQRS